MSQMTLSDMASREAAINRRRLLDAFGESGSCAIGAFCIEDLSMLAAVRSRALYLLVASNDHSQKSKLRSSPEAPNRLVSGARLRDAVARQHAMVRAIPNHHAKFWVSGLSGDETPKGVLFSGELTSSALVAGAECGNSHEFYLDLDGAESSELRSYVRWLMSCRPSIDVLPDRDLELTGQMPKLPKFSRLLLTNPNKGLKQAARALIASARHSVHVTTWAISDDNEVYAALIAACESKQVIVLSHDFEGNRHALGRLRDAGAEVRICPWMHAKLLVSDLDADAHAIVSSANILRDGMERGYEIGLSLLPGDSRISDVSRFIKSRLELATSMSISPRSSGKKVVGDLSSIDKVVKVAPRLELF